MKDSKLISIIKTFSKVEFKEFEKFISSSFFSTGRNLKPLYNALKKFYPSFESPKFSSENIFSMIYQNSAYNAVLIRRLYSDMTKLAETYLAYKGFVNTEIEKELFLLEEYNKRRAENLFDPKLKEVKHLLNKAEISEEYFLLKERIMETERDYTLKFSQQASGNIHVDQSNNFLIYSLSRMLSMEYNIFNGRGNFNQNSGSLLNVFLKNLKIEKLISDFKEEKQNDEIIQIYLYGLKFLTTDYNDDDYSRQKELVKRNIKRFNRLKKASMIFILNVYNFKKVFETGEDKYYLQAFELFEMLFLKEMEVFCEEYYAPVTLVRSIIVIADRLGKTEWIKSFLKDNISKVAPEFRDNMKHFALAYVSFAEKDYERTLEEINKITFELFTFKIDAKYLLVRAYYEMGYTEQVLSSIDSFKHFINESNNISGMFKKRYEPFIRGIHELIKLKENYDEAKSGIFRQKMEESYEYAGKNWIREKIDELISVNKTI